MMRGYSSNRACNINSWPSSSQTSLTKSDLIGYNWLKLPIAPDVNIIKESGLPYCTFYNELLLVIYNHLTQETFMTALCTKIL